MKELIVIMAQFMPIERIIEMIEESIQEWKLKGKPSNIYDPKNMDKSLSQVLSSCLMLSTKIAVNGKNLNETLSEMQAHDNFSRMMFNKGKTS